MQKTGKMYGKNKVGSFIFDGTKKQKWDMSDKAWSKGVIEGIPVPESASMSKEPMSIMQCFTSTKDIGSTLEVLERVYDETKFKNSPDEGIIGVIFDVDENGAAVKDYADVADVPVGIKAYIASVLKNIKSNSKIKLDTDKY